MGRVTCALRFIEDKMWAKMRSLDSASNGRAMAKGFIGKLRGIYATHEECQVQAMTPQGHTVFEDDIHYLFFHF